MTFLCRSYDEWEIPDGAVVYCDPPYAGTVGYATGIFDHEAFWRWVLDIGLKATIFVSEYTAPPWAEEVWRRTYKRNIRGKPSTRADEATDRLFRVG